MSDSSDHIFEEYFLPETKDGQFKLHQIDDTGKTPSKPISVRGRSLSFSAPVHKETYNSLPKSSAAEYLSEFAFKDDAFEMPEFNEGSVLHNYLIGQPLGEGGFSVCREAYVLKRTVCDNSLPEKVALKITTDPRDFRNFRKELRVWSSLNHPHILPLFECFCGDGYFVAVTYLAEKGDLQSYLARNGAMDEGLSRKVFKDVASAVQYLHETAEIAHLDIKLENVLLSSDMNAFLSDFGMSSCAYKEKIELDPPILDDGNFVSGSIASLPPEVLASDSSISDFDDVNSFKLKMKQDIWALGVLLYGLVMARLPFYDEYMPRLQHSIITGSFKPLSDHFSKELKCLIRRLLSTNPHDRPSISEVMNDSWLFP